MIVAFDEGETRVWVSSQNVVALRLTHADSSIASDTSPWRERERERERREVWILAEWG